MGKYSKNVLEYESKIDDYDKLNNSNRGPKKQLYKVVFKAIPDNRVEIKFRYNDSIINEIKNIVGRKYNCEAKTWSIPNQHYQTLLTNIYQIKKNNKEINLIINDLGDIKLEDEKQIVKLELKDDKIHISLQTFDQQFVTHLKDMVQSAQYLPEIKEWTIDMQEIDILKELIYDLNYDFNFKDNDIHKLFFSI